ncbi:MAG TPA: M10 family metallopeptidase C-terminal domain-containing protein, partial [Burkholderiaceae bacterium]
MTTTAAKPVFTTAQVISQIWQSILPWDSATITYGFPAAALSYFPASSLPAIGYLTASQQDQIRSAVQLWADLIPQAMLEAADGMGQLVFLADKGGALLHSTSAAEANLPQPDEVLGLGGDVTFSTQTLELNVLARDLQTTALHEIGHALGLFHPGPYNGCGFTFADAAAFAQDSAQYSLMSYFFAEETGAQHNDPYGRAWGAQTPLLYDVAAIQWQYGVDLNTRASDTVYGFHSTAGHAAYDFDAMSRPLGWEVQDHYLRLGRPPVITIWDGGGIDTLDLSGYATPSRVDLEEGGFSDVAGLTSNVSIAFGAMVENAVGGAGSDTLKGNRLSNVLTGGGGDDVLDGGDGEDTAVFAGARERYRVENDNGAVTVTDLTGAEGTDRLTGIEQLRFADQTVQLAARAAQPALSLRSATILEGATGKHTALIEVILSRPAERDVTFAYATEHGTATAGDYVAISGTGRIAAGQSSTVIAVEVLGDAL